MNQPYFHPNGMMPPPPNSNLPAPQYHAVAMPPMGQAQTQGKLSFALQNSKTARKNKNTANFLPTAVPPSQINRTGPPPPMTLGNWMTPPTSVSHQPPSQANINESFPPALLKFTTDAFTSVKFFFNFYFFFNLNFFQFFFHIFVEFFLFIFPFLFCKNMFIFCCGIPFFLFFSKIIFIIFFQSFILPHFIAKYQRIVICDNFTMVFFPQCFQFIASNRNGKQETRSH